MMKVSELIVELQKFPPDFEVHLDGITDNVCEDGDRFVRHIDRVRLQGGFDAVAIDIGDTVV
jgi:hypothetical protein